MKKIVFIAIVGVLFTCSSYAQLRAGADGSSHMVKLYPNPATTSIHVDIPKNNSPYALFQVYSFMGRKLYESRLYNNKNTLYLNDFYRGVYIYQLRDRSGALLETGKFQVLK